MAKLPVLAFGDLINLDNDIARKELTKLSSENALNYLSELYKGNGWAVSFTNDANSNALLLSYPKSPASILLIVKLIIRKQELTYEEARQALLDFEDNLSAKYGCSQFAIIAVNGISPKAEKLEQFNLLLHDWSYIEGLIKNFSDSAMQEPRIELFAHNKQTYKKVCSMMQSVRSIAVVQATGTGKSFLIAKLLQDFTGEKRLVMAPSLYVIQQVKEHIRQEEGKVEYMTYARSMNLSQSEIASIDLKMIVLDEFHRCGAEEWGRGVQNILNAYPGAFKFGTSATPVRHMDNARDMSAELFNSNVAENLSLAQSIVRNILPMPRYVCALYTLDEEVANLKAKVDISRAAERAKKRMLLKLEAVAIDWDQSNGVPAVLRKYLRENMRKFIVFCRDEQHLLEMEPVISEWFIKATDGSEIKTYRIFDNEPKSAENLEAFKSADTKTAMHLLLSINMLNEGLHVNEVSGVVLLRPTESPNIFYQQIGRCLKAGLNYSPVIFDLVNNFRSIRTHDFLWDLEFAHSQYAAERKNENLEDRCPVFTVMDEVREITEIFGEIKFRLDDWETMFERLVAYKELFGNCNVSVTRDGYKPLWHWLHHQRNKVKKGLLEPERRDKLATLGVEWKLELLKGEQNENWEKNFQKLCEFKKKYGHCNANSNNKDFPTVLGFVKDQRYRHTIGTLEQYRIEKLSDIGFEFKRNYVEGRWQLNFDSLVAYKKEHGHLKVDYNSNVALCLWMNKQRREFRENKLDIVRQQKLNSIGFEWGEDRDEIFEKKFSKMLEFYQKHGHLKFPHTNTLYFFAITLRKLYRRKALPAEKIKRLEAIGFSLQFQENNAKVWVTRIEQLERFFELNGHGNVTKLNESEKGLCEWLKGQRKAYFKGRLSKEVIQRIEACGFEWNFKKNDLDKRWNSNYAALLVIYQQTGTVIFSPNESNIHLHRWCSSQRQKYKQHILTKQQIAQLNALGFKWEVFEEGWEEQFAALVAYKEKHGHCRIPQKIPETKTLATWCGNVRKAYKNATLAAGKKKRLEDIGFIWDVNDNIWYTNYEKLQKHIDRYTWEHLNSLNKVLREWINKQRIEYKKGGMPEEKTMLLNRLGIDWRPTENKWNTMYEAFLKYRETHGTGIVSYADKAYRSLWTWCLTQRHNYRENKILQINSNY